MEIHHHEFGVATVKRRSFWGSLLDLTLPDSTPIEVRPKWRQTQFFHNGKQIAVAKIRFWARERIYRIEIGEEPRDFFLLIAAATQCRFGGEDSGDGGEG